MGHTISTTLVADARTLVFQKYSKETSPTHVPESREPEELVVVNLEVSDKVVTVEWERFAEGVTKYLSKFKVLPASDSLSADLSAIYLRENDKIYVTATGATDIHVGLSEPLGGK